MIAIQPTWTTERVEQLKAYFADGLSCRDIAVNIGVSRNAVIGKLSRLNLTRGGPAPERKTRKTAAESTAKGTPAQQYRLLQVVYEDEPVEDIKVTSAHPCSLLDLSAQRCRWPIDVPETDDLRFCGNPPLKGTPYCTGHSRLAYRTGPRLRVARG
ncbi:GcrA-like regulator [Bradyrhizobium jicamae]|uniref:GcrA family cell cycle regulator n=1 Tax=Bradyrhizobium jicamae TaxID=280332 RepID=UPI001BA9859D|nr:GcrA family cell cycle regulator [Bradyrhizobium jicamae]MBR0752571.1 GcrA-like regulator [Bradyrhizobium jicamae]